MAGRWWETWWLGTVCHRWSRARSAAMAFQGPLRGIWRIEFKLKTYSILYTHTYKHTCMHAYIYIYVQACMHTYMHTYIHLWPYDLMMRRVSRLNDPRGLAVCRGELLIADFLNSRIRAYDLSTGIVTTKVGTTHGYAGERQRFSST